MQLSTFCYYRTGENLAIQPIAFKFRRNRNDFAYNKEHVGDVLLVIVADDQGAENQVKRVGDVARVSLVEAPETVVAWNIFNASALLGDINGTGQVTLTDEQIEKVNTAIKDAGFSETLEKDDTPKIVVGFVKSCKNTQIQIIYLSHKQK